MRIGDTVVAKREYATGRVIAIDDYDRATVRLNDGGVEELIHICDLTVVKEAGCDG